MRDGMGSLMVSKGHTLASSLSPHFSASHQSPVCMNLYSMVILHGFDVIGKEEYTMTDCLDDFDSFSRFASRMLPSATPVPQATTNNSSIPTHTGTTDPSSTTSNGPKVGSAYGVRALPIKIYLPDNAPVIHELIPPLIAEGEFLSSSCPPLPRDNHHYRLKSYHRYHHSV